MNIIKEQKRLNAVQRYHDFNINREKDLQGMMVLFPLGTAFLIMKLY